MSDRTDGLWLTGEGSAACPTCGQHVENALDAFCGHWVQSTKCEGPPLERPDGLRWVPGGDWSSFARAVHTAPSLAVLLDAVDAADGTIDPEVPVFLDGIDSARGGDNPWLDASGPDDYVDCPACGKETFNERDAFYDHWTGNEDCPGPMAVTIDRWRRLGVDVSPLLDETAVDDPTTTKVYEAVEDPDVGGGTDVYDRSDSEAGAPGRGSINYCPHCGANVEPYESPTYCPRCGDEI
jgi:endogenous inhibitor of DNA gyrase (YacG/DUF329 family)